ncbi:hypothetical protein [Peribacillus butanolivorans]|uniref:hypothetical protein n=1 Tax=Peribacillus butanolivorans TaxID=421767 RepID=UPI0036D77D0E
MGTLRNNNGKRQEVKDKTKALFSELLDLDEDYAIKLVDWYLEKTKTNKNNIKKVELKTKLKTLRKGKDAASIAEIKKTHEQIKAVSPPNHPKYLQKGDIVHVNYGQGYSGEISNGHYGVVIKRKGDNYLIAPLTSTAQPDGTNTKELENLGLPGKRGPVQTGYVNFGQMKFIDYRRLENVKGLSKLVNVSDELPDLLTKFNNIINT